MTIRTNTPMFTSFDVFDPTSTFSRLRTNPEQTLYEFFDALPARQAAEWRNVGDTTSPYARGAKVAGLVLRADAPDKELPLEVEAGVYPQLQGPPCLMVHTRFRSLADRPKAGLACEALLITGDILEMLCGPEAVASPEAARLALHRLFIGDAGRDALETAAVLSAVPVLTGRVVENGKCVFEAYKLPEHAGEVASLPPCTAVVVVIEPSEEGNS